METLITKQQKPDLHTVRQFDIKQYMGRWFEIARKDNRFEKYMTKVQTTYTLLKSGNIKVINSGIKRPPQLNCRYKTIVGIAKCPNSIEPGHLRVSFFPFIYSDYRILELDTIEYQYALVGSSSDKYLWILSRTQTLHPEIKKHLLKKAQERGFKTDNLIWEDSTPN